MTIFQLNASANTKRKILLESSKIFYPFGFFGPSNIRSRILLQNLWKDQLDWDETQPEKDLKAWRSLAKDLIKIKNISTLRYEGSSITDASIQAFSCCIYLVEEISSLIFSKSKVAPIKTKRSIAQ